MYFCFVDDVMFFQGDHFSGKPVIAREFLQISELSGKEACEEKLSTYVHHSNGKIILLSCYVLLCSIYSDVT